MSDTTNPHPIKRIRNSFLELSDESGMKKRASTVGFARWLDRSESLIRNVEGGLAPFSSQLARLIEKNTGVSSDWLLSSPAATDPILDVEGKVWNAGERLDPYHGGEWQPNWNKLLATSPRSVPRLIGRMVEAQVELDLGAEKREFLGRVISLLMEFKSFSSENFRNMAADALRAETPFMMNEIWSFMGHSNEAPDRSVSEFQAAGGDSIEKSARKARRR